MNPLPMWRFHTTLACFPRALETLYGVLFCMVRVMAPFTPFITEMMYQNLKKVLSPGALGQVGAHP